MFGNEKYHMTPGTGKRIDAAKDAGKVAHREESDIHISEDNFDWRISIDYNDLKNLENNEKLLCDVLHNKFDCLSTLVYPVQEGSSKSQQVFRAMLTPNLQLTVWKDDLTRHPVDAIVNAANEELHHRGGLALALVRAGGIEIQEESTKYIRQHGRVAVGCIAITKAGKLPCKQIIHAVGPQWTDESGQMCMHSLEMLIKNILNYATSADIETIAIPAVSSGVFCFPLNLCTKTIVHTIQMYFQNKQVVSRLKEIHLVGNEDPTVAAFKAYSEAILGKNDLESCGRQEETIVGSVTLQIVEDFIELQQADVIVNFLNPWTDLKAQSWPKSIQQRILQRAGEEMERELNTKVTMSPYHHEPILITKGFKLSCRYVFHVVWPPSEHVYSAQKLSKAMENCLLKCNRERITSISFPILGTDDLGISKLVAANIMFTEVSKFANHNPGRPLTVKFVILPGDVATYKAFSDEMAKYKSKSQSLNNYNVSQWTREKKENRPATEGPAVSLMGSDPEKMTEAKAWIQRMLTSQTYHIIENNYIHYLRIGEHIRLSQLQKSSGISIKEIISPRKAELKIQGPKADLIEVVIKIEQMLCEVQEEVTGRKEHDLWKAVGQSTGQQSKHQGGMQENKFLECAIIETQEILDRKKEFEKCGLQVVKVEHINNPALMKAFLNKKLDIEKRVNGKPVSQRLFQQVPYQFCKMVSRVGFQRLCSVPCEPEFGDGIYFMKNLKSLASKIKATPATDQLIYIFEADVLTGSFCQGQKSIIVPPSLSPGAIERHDSVVDSVSRPEIFVIFSGMQAMPCYLWTCTQNYKQSQNTSFSLGSWQLFSFGSSVD